MDKSKFPIVSLPNALKHGSFSGIALLPGEDADEFRELHASLIEEWQPEGPSEEEEVLTIAKCMLRIRRVHRFTAGQVALLHGNREHWVSLALGRLELDVERDNVDKILRDCPDDIRDHIAKSCPRGKFKSQADWSAEVRKLLGSMLRSELTPHDGDLVEPVELIIKSPPSPKISLNELLEMEETTENRINATRERAIKRLVHIKTVKQMLGSPSLSLQRSRQQAHQIQLPSPAEP